MSSSRRRSATSRARSSRIAATPDGAQAGYDAGRDLVEAVLAAGKVRPALRALRADLLARGRAQVRWAEQLDRPGGSTSTAPLAPLPGAAAGIGPRRPDPALARELARVAAGFDGVAGVWVHELDTGRYAGFEADTRFAAASTVKLGALVAAIRASPAPERSRWWYDARQLGAWSSNLAANRIAGQLGYGAVTDGLRRLGMTSSTYPGPYRATTAVRQRPPGPHTRVTTARDLGRALYRLHAGAHGDARALGRLGLTRRQAALALRVLASSQPVGDNVGALRRWLPGRASPRRTAGSPTSARPRRSSTRAAGRRSSSSRPIGPASLCARRSALGAAFCSRPGSFPSRRRRSRSPSRRGRRGSA